MRNNIHTKILLSIAAILEIIALESLLIADNQTIDIPIESYTLSNGLRVVLSPNHFSQTVAVAVYYNAGSKYETEGKSGIAHLVEHMMFQGSKNVEKLGFFKIISASGGSFNGTTTEDYTNYYEALPSNMLEIALYLESDRMKSLKIEEENFENQRMVVLEEKMSGLENEPYEQSIIEINKLAYDGFWQYAHPIIGENQDIENAKSDWVMDFLEKFYDPSNAVLVVSGDFELEKTKNLIDKYFGNIPSKKQKIITNIQTSTQVDSTIQPGFRKKIITDKYAPLPALHIAYNIPPMRSPDYYPLKLVAIALGDGESSRFFQKLIKKERSVQEMYVDIDGKTGPDIFWIFVILSGKNSISSVTEKIDDEISSIAEKGLKQEELIKVKNRIKMKYISAINDNLKMALMLGKYELLWQDASLVKNEISRYFAVKNEDIVLSTKKYLKKDNRAIVEVIPAEKNSD